MSGMMKQSFTTQVDTVGDPSLEPLGSHRYEGGKWYKWVKFNDGSGNVSIAAGDFLGYYGLTGYPTSEVTGDTSASANRLVPAGVAVSAPADGQGCWIQIKGAATVPAARLNTNVNDGEQIQLDTTDKMAEEGDAAGDKPIGYAVDESAGTVVLDFPW